MTLLVLNNFNFGMTGGQFSATTPPDARLGSGFLNRLEKPLDISRLAVSAGAARTPGTGNWSVKIAFLNSLVQAGISGTICILSSVI